MIPKLIHYCWFGKNPLPKSAIKYIESWRKYLPDYEIKEWNEDNFDINNHPYVEEAYNAKKYAFVTDYVRLYVLFHYGGIYMDTDVEVIKSLDTFLQLPAFSGFEDDTHIPTGIMASEKNGEWVGKLLAYYDNKHFILPDSSYDLTTNVESISHLMRSEGFKLKNGLYNHRNIVTIYPKNYFCPKDFRTGKIKLTNDTYCIHHFAGSWFTTSQKIYKLIENSCGSKVAKFISKCYKCRFK